MTRTLEQINTEYSTVCLQLGDKTYKKLIMEVEINNLVTKANALDQEVTALKKSSEVTQNTILTEENGFLDLPEMTAEQLAAPELSSLPADYNETTLS